MPVKKVLVEPRAVCTRKAVIVRSTKKQQLFVQRKSSNCWYKGTAGTEKNSKQRLCRQIDKKTYKNE